MGCCGYGLLRIEAVSLPIRKTAGPSANGWRWRQLALATFARLSIFAIVARLYNSRSFVTRRVGLLRGRPRCVRPACRGRDLLRSALVSHESCMTLSDGVWPQREPMLAALHTCFLTKPTAIAKAIRTGDRE